jgi:hypothetical protein
MGSASEKRLALDLQTLVEAGSTGDPERLFRAVENELEPVVDHLRRHNPPPDLDKLRWILIELVSNSLTAPLGKALGERTGLTRRQLLDAFGTSVLWPHPSGNRIARTEPSGVRGQLEAAVGSSVGEFLKLPLCEKLKVLGISLSEEWLRVVVRVGEARSDFEILVQSDHGPSDDDHREILKRFEDYAGERNKVIELRKTHEDGNGICPIPSFTGGGGAGLIVCIQAAKDLGLHFDYLFDEAKAGRTIFRVATWPIEATAIRPDG